MIYCSTLFMTLLFRINRLQEQNKFNSYVTIVTMVPMVIFTAVVIEITMANVIKVIPGFIM